MFRKGTLHRSPFPLFGGLRRNKSRGPLDRSQTARESSTHPPQSFSVERLEVRELLSTIFWENRGAGSDGFDALFGAGAPANAARAVVDAAIDAWERVVTDFNHDPGVTSPNGYDLDLTISIDAPGADTFCGASTSTTIGADGKPSNSAQPWER